MPINYKLYPKNWKSFIVPTITNRSKGKCEECGLSNGQTVWSVNTKKKRGRKTVYRKLWLPLDPCLEPSKSKEVTVILTVAHLDNDAHNHNVKLDRLKHLCQRCHLQADAKYKAIKRRCGHYCNHPKCSLASCQFNPL